MVCLGALLFLQARTASPGVEKVSATINVEVWS